MVKKKRGNPESILVKGTLGKNWMAGKKRVGVGSGPVLSNSKTSSSIKMRVVENTGTPKNQPDEHKVEAHHRLGVEAKPGGNSKKEEKKKARGV